MAKFHKNLKYHKDEVVKHSLTEEEKTFLKELQTEMNTQDNVGQADPRFWVIKGSVKAYYVQASEADGYELYNSNAADTVASNMEECKDYIEENILEEINDIDGLNRTLSIEDTVYGEALVVKWTDDGEEETQTLHDAEEVSEWLEEFGFDEYSAIPYAIIDKIYDNTMFLTEKDAAEHLRLNHYHYSEDAHTYAMTAWRSPRVEKLLKILQEVEW